MRLLTLAISQSVQKGIEATDLAAPKTQRINGSRMLVWIDSYTVSCGPRPQSGQMSGWVMGLIILRQLLILVLKPDFRCDRMVRVHLGLV